MLLFGVGFVLYVGGGVCVVVIVVVCGGGGVDLGDVWFVDWF